MYRGVNGREMRVTGVVLKNSRPNLVFTYKRMNYW